VGFSGEAGAKPSDDCGRRVRRLRKVGWWRETARVARRTERIRNRRRVGAVRSDRFTYTTIILRRLWKFLAAYAVVLLITAVGFYALEWMGVPQLR